MCQLRNLLEYWSPHHRPEQFDCSGFLFPDRQGERKVGSAITEVIAGLGNQSPSELCFLCSGFCLELGCRLYKGVSAIKQRSHGEVGDSGHTVGLNLGRCLGLGQDALARIQTSATTGDLQQEASSTVIGKAEVLVTQRLDDAVTQGALLKDEHFRTLTFD